MNRFQSRLGATEGRPGELETRSEENIPTKARRDQNLENTTEMV